MTALPSCSARVVVLGGGLAGTLAAAALAPHVGEVLVLEHDPVLPEAPAPRPRLPQAAHAHILWAGGADAMEELLPGVTDEWLAAGAHRIPIPKGMVSFSPAGWYRRSWPDTHYLIGASRNLIDWAVRRRVLRLPNVRVRTGVKVCGLQGDAARVVGVVVRDARDERQVVAADLVVDATGRGSRSTRWLREIGGPEVRETVVDAGVRYASRKYRAPEGAETGWPVIHIPADPREDRPGLFATIISIEDGQWHVSLSGTRGAEPSAGEDLFEEFARRVRHPLVAELLARAEPVSEVSVFTRTANRRRHFEQAALPEGFLVMGDAATSLNPVYGHGMSAAARGAVALRDTTRRTSVLSPGFASKAQRAIARPAAAAWMLAVAQDRFYPGAVGRKPSLVDRLGARYIHRLSQTAVGNALVVRRLTDVMTMRRPAHILGLPDVLLAAARGSRMPPLDGPELTRREQDVLDRPPLRSAGAAAADPGT
ncbi:MULTISPECIES: FAD-dependent oxidoreductase [unclassified Streptomyces]|uniref:FAD-dependent oxidoreductase n=1 Tax=unclassified Streptomyces TaxID=2593676 RepID=UPI002E3250DF|nr:MULTISPECIES: FAD-dependent monooxygenase [unclassified Streptomyces]WUC68994.1 FAD-dependent monooxygenase [Streptomyces sp. NBC_00539]